jgi:hypothetical protein
MNGDGIRFNIAALALAAGLFWGAAILIVSAANLLWPGYGRLFLDLAGSIYPGYRPGVGDCRYALRIGGRSGCRRRDRLDVQYSRRLNETPVVGT